MWLLLKGLFTKITPQMWAIAGVVVLITVMFARIQYLSYSRDRLRVDARMLQEQVATAIDINRTTYANSQAINAELHACVLRNKILKENSLQAVEDHKAAVDKMRADVLSTTRRVKEALQHETCAMVAIPSDVERVLRARAASTNTDS